MQMNKFADYKFSRLMLGTVQFGLPYGVANQTGQPDYEDSRLIVSTAIDGGVNCFDTAAAYGCSEEVLGSAIHDLGVADKVIVVTKIKPLSPEELANHSKASIAIEHSVETSLKRLRLDCLPVVLFHRESDARYLDVLEHLKAKGLLVHAGVSCDNRPGPAAGFVAGGQASALQLPGNILDRRHLNSGIFHDAAIRGLAVFIRSVYLQGLLVMPEASIPQSLQAVIPLRRRLISVAAEAGMNISELALRYMLTQDGVTSVLVGVETLSQMKENIAMFNRGIISSEIMAAVNDIAPDLPETILTPGFWPKPEPTSR